MFHMKPKIGTKLKEALDAKGLSVAAFSRLLDMQTRRVNNYVNDIREADYPTLLKMCDVLDVTPNWLFEIEDGPGACAPTYKPDVLAAVTHHILTCALDEYISDPSTLPDGIVDDLTGAILTVYEEHAGANLDVAVATDRERIIAASHNVFRFAINQSKQKRPA